MSLLPETYTRSRFIASWLTTAILGGAFLLGVAYVGSWLPEAFLAYEAIMEKLQ